MTFPTYPPPPDTPHPLTDRDAVVRSFGLTGPLAELDGFATQLAQEAKAPYAMVNIFGTVQQQFLGLHTPGAGSDLPPVGRNMPLHHGFCPEVVQRKKALVLPDVFASPRFSGNAVVDLIGIRTYAGAPLLHGDTVLGTVCFVGPDQRDLSTGRQSLALVKHHAARVMTFLTERSGIRPFDA